MILLRTLFLVFVSCMALNARVLAASPTILVVGDSLSAGYGIDVNKGWVRLLQIQVKAAGIPHQIVNASISGDTTGGGLRRLPQLLKTYSPRMVVIELGANDGLRGVPLSEIDKNFSQMIALIRDSRARVVILRMELPPNYGPDYTHGFSAIYDRLGRLGDDVTVAPFFLADVVLVPKLIQADGLHPTAEAQPTMLKAVWPSIAVQLKTP